jgi:hypothetical protein
MPTSSQEQSPKASEDDDGLFHRSFGFEAKSIDVENRTVTVIASSAALDSYDDYIDQASWNLSRYVKNPVVLYGHNRVGFLGPMSAKDTLPIGYSSNVAVWNGNLEATLHFVNEKANPMAEMVWQGFVQKSIRAVSVGFRPRNVDVEKRDGIEVYRLSDCELYEISVCPIPANPDAVAKSAARDHTRLRALAKSVSRDTDNEPSPKIEVTMPAENKTENTVDITALVASHEKALSEEKGRTVKAEETITALQKTVTDLTAKFTTLTAEKDELAEKLAASEKECAKHLAKALELEVEDLIGKKFVPAQKDAMLKLAKTNKASFDEIVAATPDLPMLKQVIKSDTKASNGKSGGDYGQKVIAKLQKAVGDDD